MKLKIRSFLFVLLCAVLLISCAKPIPLPKIDRQPPAANYSYFNPDPALPVIYDPTSDNPFQNDYRSADLSGLDLSQSLDGLLNSDFDSLTLWPPANKLPVGFDPQAILELGKDPGLGVRQLHEQGITGEGVGIAIIDQPLLVTHQEYSSRLKLYEEINIPPGEIASMHGPAVSSLAVGKTVGTAPRADLYFIANDPWVSDGESSIDYDFTSLAQAVRRIIEVNESLPTAHKIRVLSISIGWVPDNKGYDDIIAAINEARNAGIFVLDMNIWDTYRFNLYGLARDPLANPNDLNSYAPTLWWTEKFFRYYADYNLSFLMVPMASRTFASPTGDDDYTWGGMGGQSWTAPYMAGIYAMACQVKPDITPEEFWETALQTGKTITIERDGRQYKMGIILDPPSLIEALK